MRLFIEAIGRRGAIAIRPVKDGETLAISGFTKSGEPKRFFQALARYLAENAPKTKINLLAGAVLGLFLPFNHLHGKIEGRFAV